MVKLGSVFLSRGFWYGLGALMGVWVWNRVYLEMEFVCSVRLGGEVTGWANRAGFRMVGLVKS